MAEKIYVLPEAVTINTTNDILINLNELVKGDYESLCLDASVVAKLDTAGLQVIISAYKTALRDQKRFAVVNPSTQFNEICNISGIGNTLPLKR